MKRKLLIWLALIFPLVLQAQNDTVRTLIITEANATNLQAYLELTNVGDVALNLSDFKVSAYSPWASADKNPSWGVRLPDSILEPGETFVLGNVFEGESNPELYEEFGGEVTNPFKRERIDFPIFRPEYAPGTDDGKDSISPYWEALVHWNGGTIARVIENYEDVNGDSIWVDKIYRQADNGSRQSSNTPREYTDVAGVFDAWSGGYVLIRKTTVTEGNLDWEESRGSDLGDSEWIVIPMRGATAGSQNPVFTTLGHHGESELDATSLSSSSISIDWNNNTMTVPFGIYRNRIMHEFNLGEGLAWDLNLSPALEDSAHTIVRTGDTLKMFAVGSTLKQINFRLIQGDAPNSLNQVFPLSRRQENSAGAYFFSQVFSVTDSMGVMDTINGILYNERVDTLFKYLEKAPKASWEVVYLNDENDRVDLKNGDILKVTAENGDIKEYFLSVDTLPLANSNAELSAITWPDMPDYFRNNPKWNGDTIPDFRPDRLNYTVEVPSGTRAVPALLPTPDYLNAKIEVISAITVNGPVEDRTTTFRVTATDDSTVMEYKIIFKEEVLPSEIQEVIADPIITEVAWDNSQFIEIGNPGTRPVDLSSYVIVVCNLPWGGASNLPAALSNSGFNGNIRFKYIPGMQWKATSETEWATDQTLIPDLEVNPNLDAGETFTMGNANWGAEASQIRSDVVFDYTGNWEDDKLQRFKDAGVRIIEHRGPSSLVYNTTVVGIYKILNDSVKQGLKPVNDLEDFKLIDVYGVSGEEAQAPAGKPVPANWWTVKRKAEYWQGDTLPGNAGSFDTIPSQSEWILVTEDSLLSIGQSQANLRDDRDVHTFTQLTFFLSTINSYTYQVSRGYVSPQNIRGPKTGTTIEDFYSNIIKRDAGQVLEIIGTGGIKTEGAVEDKDTLKVTSSDGKNITKYVITVTDEGLNSDALLTSDELTITVNGSSGTISGFEYGTSANEILKMVEKPQGAILQIVDADGTLVPHKLRNFYGLYNDVFAFENLFVMVTAEDGVNQIKYHLEPTYPDGELYAFSNIYRVYQEEQVISGLEQGVYVPDFLKDVHANLSATLKIIDKAGYERTKGAVNFDDQLVVTAQDGGSEKVYNLSFIQENAIGTEAYLSSTQYVVNDLDFTVSDIVFGTFVQDIIPTLYATPGATIEVLNADGNPVVEGEITVDHTIRVTSEDGNTVNNYTLILVTSIHTETFVTPEIVVYPNPVVGSELNIKSANARIDQVQIIDLKGRYFDIQEVEYGTGDITLNVSDLSKGIYILHISTDLGVETKLFTKQ